MTLDWHPIDEHPAAPCQVEFFHGKLFLTDQHGNRRSPVIAPYRDERRQLGYWDGECWRSCMTGHECPEW